MKNKIKTTTTPSTAAATTKANILNLYLCAHVCVYIFVCMHVCLYYFFFVYVCFCVHLYVCMHRTYTLKFMRIHNFLQKL